MPRIRDDEAPKARQVYEWLRQRIHQGVYAAGTKLPSTRELAGELGVSRTLAVNVYEQLAAEGYVEGRQGSGTYVADLAEWSRLLAGLEGKSGSAAQSSGTGASESGEREMDVLGGRTGESSSVRAIEPEAEGGKERFRRFRDTGSEIAPSEAASSESTLPETKPFEAPLSKTVRSEAAQSGPLQSGRFFDGIDFKPSMPALDAVPHRMWKEAALAAFGAAPPESFGYADPAGEPELRAQIGRMLLFSKGIDCSSQQMIVTSGATQAVALLAQLLLRPGDRVVMEDPTAPFMRAIFKSAGARIIPVPVDRQGMRVEDIPGDVKPKLVFVTPSHQFPCGSILSIQRRVQLLEYARGVGCFVIEDDYDSEFRYAGLPVRALRELDAERVVYIGTFSKNLFPALRLGYMVVPAELTAPLLKLKRLADGHSPTLPQLTLARFVADGHLERHMSRMKRLYAKRRSRLIDCLERSFGDRVRIFGDSAGLHLVAEFPAHRIDAETMMRLEERRVRLYPAEDYAIVKGRHERQLIMGFGNVTERQIAEGVEAMAAVLSER
jgi:GntR family transcriptional regulator/MocR family aminotransferase